MKLFCPTCDAVVESADGAQGRCPQCHKKLQTGSDWFALLPSIPAAKAAGGNRLLLVAAAVVVLAAAAGGYWAMQNRLPPKAVAAAAVAVAGDIAGKMASVGLKGDAAIAPGTVSDSLRKVAQGQADLAAFLKAQLGPNKLQLLSPVVRRKHKVENAATLLEQIQSGKANPIHSIEAAFLTQALAEARGLKPELVIETAGLQTPLLLSRTRLGVRVDSKIIEPLAETPMLKPQPIAQNEAVAAWLILRAHASRVAGNFADVYLNLEAADKIFPGSPAIQFARGVAQMDQGLLDKGSPTCEAALAKTDDALAHLFMAEIAQAMEQPVQALQHTEMAIKSHPELAEAYSTKAMLVASRYTTVPDAQKAQTLTDAKAMFDKAISLDPQIKGARAGLAQLALMQKDMVGAEAQLREAVVKFKDYDCAMLLAELLQSQQKAVDAVTLLESLPLPPDDERAVVALAKAYMAAKMEIKALEFVEKAYVVNKGSRQIALLRADLLRKNNKIAEAIAALEPLREGGADGDRMTMLQAQLYLQNQQPKQAVAVIEPLMKGLVGQPSERDAMALLIIAYLLDGQGDKGEQAGNQAIERSVFKATDLVGIYLQAGDAMRAQRALERLVQTAKPDKESAATLAMLYVSSQQKDKAIALRDQMVKAAGADGKAWEELMDKAIETAEAEVKKQAEGATPPPEAAQP